VQIVLDWDGTCTVRDSLVAAIHALGDPSVYEGSFQQRFGSYGEALAAEVGTLKVTPEEAAAWALANVELRPGLHELVELYRPVIVSSGLPQLIRPVLEREGLGDLELRSNGAEPSPDGWRVTFRDEGVCPVCGDKCKRRSLPEGRPLVFVGDGWSDRCASLAADRVFARTGLASYLDEEGVPYEPYETFFDVAAALGV
jgi:2-hydroxy-3-keto-5-methylthiopentenyl-1-phosphate phosphatase